MEKLKVVYRKISELKPYENNPRFNKDAVKHVANSIKEYGFKNPIIIDENDFIVAGHTRWLAAKKLKLKEAPTITINDLTEEQIKAFRIADNKVAEYSEWDMDKLHEEMQELLDLDYDLSIIGFDDEEIEGILNILPKEVIQDEVPDIQEEKPPITQPGDIWLLGPHRLMCGDSTDKDHINILTESKQIDFIHTDPPYGMNAVSGSGVLSENYRGDILNDDSNEVAIQSYEICQEMYRNAKQVWWGANYYSEPLPSSECWIVWDKNNGESDQTDCELAWTNFRSVVRQYTQASEKVDRVHPTQKPVSLIVWIINKFEKKDHFETWLDLFGGSGSTLIAAEYMERTSYIMELDPYYCDVIVQRYINYIGSTENISLVRGKKEMDYESIGD